MKFFKCAVKNNWNTNSNKCQVSLKIFRYNLEEFEMLLHSLGLVYKSMRGVMTNSIDRDQWLNVTSESRDRI
jgi:hypothetical protein